ncbi:DUF858-domain-containing protein [Auriculariales sp. MPI-PUGE-AT-0066]|nr:DUF858-domain-containing protein [Auriculariales sp. MPI-PUGE-AT-0066]
MSIEIRDPDLNNGLRYWNTQPATIDGVLGGYGNGTLPYVDALGSRQLLMSLRPDLCAVPSALRPLDAQPRQLNHRIRALDLGAGVGRVTQDVLLHLCDDVVLVEPVQKFLQQAFDSSPKFRGVSDAIKSVTFVRDTLQNFDPRVQTPKDKILARAGAPPQSREDTFDVVWMQWCLGHTSNQELIALLKRAKLSFRDEESLVVVKENCCNDNADGSPCTVFDEEDSSVTRSNLAWCQAFRDAGLSILRNEIQHGLPEGLYPVRMWALR